MSVFCVSRFLLYKRYISTHKIVNNLLTIRRADVIQEHKTGRDKSIRYDELPRKPGSNPEPGLREEPSGA